MEDAQLHQVPEPQSSTVIEALSDEADRSKEGGSKEKTQKRQKRRKSDVTLKKGLGDEQQVFWSKNKHRCPSCVKINNDKTKYADAAALWMHYHNETYHACLKKIS